METQPDYNNTFNIDGYHFYAQFRRCGKESCKCSAGELHGPYWYKRNLNGGYIHYVGRNLPADIIEKIEKLSSIRGALLQESQRITQEFVFLNRRRALIDKVLKGESLNFTESIEYESLLDSLVLTGANQVTQDIRF